MRCRYKIEKVPVLLSFVGALIYISLIFNDNLWMDEAFSAALVRNCSLQQVLERSAADTLPPLYNILTYFMTCVLGYSAWAMKLVSVVPMIVCMFVSAVVVKKYFGTFAASVFVMCLWGMPYLLYYGVEIRMYSLGLMFALLSGLFAVSAYYEEDRKASKKAFLLMAVFACGAGYTHHFAFVTAGFCYGFLMLALIIFKREKIKYWAVSVILTLLLYVPCLLTTMSQMKRVSGYFTMPDASLHFILQCLRMPFTTNVTVVSALLMLIFAIVVLVEIVAGKNLLVLFLVMIYPGILLFGVAAGKLLGANIFTDRYLIPSIGFLWLAFSISVNEFVKRIPARFKKIAAVAIVILVVMCDIICYSVQFKSEYDSGVNTMKEYFSKNISNGDSYVIFEDNYQIEICFRYYFPDFKKIKPDELDKSKSGTQYYIQVKGFEEREKEITDCGFTTVKEGDFSFDRYEFSLFRIE